MPSFEAARRIASVKNNGAKTIGQIHKEESDWLMEETFWNDPQSKVCYIYDFFHDENPSLAEGMTYENTTKTKIDAKFIVTKYSSIDKDQVEYHLQFKPSQKVRFDESDELYYFETDYKSRYSVEFPIGLFVDIPDEKNVYKKWLIVAKEEGNQFIKFSVLPCDYYLQWIENTGTERIKRKMWCVSRAMNSYTSGRWVDRYMLGLDDIQKVWIPMNPFTERLSYLNGEGKNQRIVLSAPIAKPLVWQVSKVENTKPLGIIKITLDQDVWDENTDYVNLETGEMFADYYDSNIEPTDPDAPTPTPSTTYGKITASTSTIKVGGSYKTLTLKLYDVDDNEVTDNYSSATFDWSCYIKGNETDDLSNKVTWLNGSLFNQKKIKFSDDRSYLNKILVIHCRIFDEYEGYTNVLSEFELVI